MKKFILLFLMILSVSFIYSYEYEAGDHGLLIMPTAYTMEKGDSYFSDSEILLLNFTHAPVKSTHLSIFSMFPITSSFIETITFGFKNNYFNIKNLSSSAYGTFTPKGGIYSIGNVISLSGDKVDLHGATSIIKVSSVNEFSALYMIGAKLGKPGKTSFILEYTSSGVSIIDDNIDFISLGFRFHSKSIAWDIGGIRPLVGDLGEFIMFPILKATIQF